MTKVTEERVKTLADLVRVCEIDTTEWEIERWVANKWDMGYKDKQQTAHSHQLFQVKAWLKRKVALVDAKAEIASLVQDAKSLIVRVPTRIIRPHTLSGNMLEVGVPDLHMGKLAWGRETGHDNYDVAIAKRTFENALEALIQRTSSYSFDEIVFPVGNDLLHTDSQKNTTTAGTPQDSDGRFQKTFITTRKMIVAAIERLRQLAPVKVLMVPGNHDQLAVWHLGDSLSSFFHSYTDVVIDNEPPLRKYHQFGKVMLMFAHGDKGKLSDYPLLMATEQPTMFGSSVHREAHTGHIHQLRVQEHHGVRVRVLSALCAPDAWHAEKAYVGQARAAEAFVWNREEGLIATAVYTAPSDRAR